MLAGLSRGAIYALLALPFTLIYGVIGRINLAFGEMLMGGGIAAMVASRVVITDIGWYVSLIVDCALIAALIYSAGTSRLFWRWVFGPLGRANSSGQAMIVASPGCLLAIQEFIRLVWFSCDFNLPPIWQFTQPLARSGHFIVNINGSDILAIALAGIIAVILHHLMHKTAFGRAWHAISQDGVAAALCGVHLHRIEGLTFTLAGLLCAVAGTILALKYGVVNFHSGTLLGFKALTEAILGGIGIVRGHGWADCCWGCWNPSGQDISVIPTAMRRYLCCWLWC